MKNKKLTKLESVILKTMKEYDTDNIQEIIDYIEGVDNKSLRGAVASLEKKKIISIYEMVSEDWRGREVVFKCFEFTEKGKQLLGSR